MDRALKNVLVTGGAGFVGSNFIAFVLRRPDFRGRVVNLDALTYAGNPENLASVQRRHSGTRYFFEKGDIRDRVRVEQIFADYDIDAVVHFAAESHVDRSIQGPETFVSTNVLGTFTLLDVARERWGRRQEVLFHHVSTDEVFGSLGDDGRFTETTPYSPRSPYSATKAGSDHLVRAYHHTYGLPVTVSNCSNNYGPYQFPEKLIPLMIVNMLDGKPLPIYGDGRNVRDWLYVEDHAAAIWRIVTAGPAGGSWNIGGDSECENIHLVNVLCEKVAAHQGMDRDWYKRLISFVRDRPGHDHRYAMDCSRIKRELGWVQSVNLSTGLDLTVSWYLKNPAWVARVRSGSYREWIDRNYAGR
jgi:dTDP-glucose 4,6-dehydratase